MSDFNSGFTIGLQNGLALLRSHLEKVDGFDGKAFDRDAKQLFDGIKNANGTTPEMSHGIEWAEGSFTNKVDIQSALDLQRHHRS